MGELRLFNSGISINFDKKEQITINWKKPFVSFFQNSKVGTVDDLTHQWIDVYKNHMECFRRGDAQNGSEFDFQSLGITDFYGYHDRGIDEWILVIDQKIVIHKFFRKDSNRFPMNYDYNLLYIEAPDTVIEKVYEMMSKLMSKSLAT